jgi:hypothetical protein
VYIYVKNDPTKLHELESETLQREV